VDFTQARILRHQVIDTASTGLLDYEEFMKEHFNEVATRFPVMIFQGIIISL